MAVDAQGNAFVAGVSFGTAGDQDYVIIKYSSAGVALWNRGYNGPGNGNDGATAVAVDGSGNVIVTGLSIGTSGLSSYFDYATVRYSGAGVRLWTNRYNSPANNEDQATDVVVNGSGNVFVTGESWNGSATDYETIKYSAAGVPLWTNRYHWPLAANNFATAIAVNTNGNVFVTGSDGSFASTNGGYATIKYSNAGMPVWTIHYNGRWNDNARAIALDSSGKPKRQQD